MLFRFRFLSYFSLLGELHYIMYIDISVWHRITSESPTSRRHLAQAPNHKTSAIGMITTTIKVGKLLPILIQICVFNAQTWTPWWFCSCSRFQSSFFTTDCTHPRAMPHLKWAGNKAHKILYVICRKHQSIWALCLQELGFGGAEKHSDFWYCIIIVFWIAGHGLAQKWMINTPWHFQIHSLLFVLEICLGIW